MKKCFSLQIQTKHLRSVHCSIYLMQAVKEKGRQEHKSRKRVKEKKKAHVACRHSGAQQPAAAKA